MWTCLFLFVKPLAALFDLFTLDHLTSGLQQRPSTHLGSKTKCFHIVGRITIWICFEWSPPWHVSLSEWTRVIWTIQKVQKLGPPFAKDNWKITAVLDSTQEAQHISTVRFQTLLPETVLSEKNSSCSSSSGYTWPYLRSLILAIYLLYYLVNPSSP